jgi:hypothetical protein
MSDMNRSVPEGELQRGARVCALVGDRLCIRCGFNLTGQMVLREGHYQMLIVRCPECATVAALQEYPALGRWANRWAALLAGLWLLVVIALLLATAGATLGFTILAAEGFGEKYAAHISKRHNEWVRSLSAEETTAFNGANSQWLSSQADGPGSWVASAWWARQDPEALLREIGGPIGGLDPRGLWNWPWLALAAAVAGAVWSLVMLPQRRRKVMAAMLIPMGLAGVFGYFALSTTAYSSWMGGAQPVSQIANNRLWPIVVPGLLLSALPMMWLGVWAGRPMVRGMVRAFLPPRMLGSLAFLWIAEGKEPPRPPRRVI